MMILNQLRPLARKYLFTINTIRYRVEYRRLAEMFQRIGPQQKVMDGGGGSGEMLKKLLGDGYCREGMGLEPEPSLFALMEENYREEPALSATQGGLLEVPFPDAHFDCVISTQVLEHIEDHERAAAELARVLKPGGFAVISVPHPPEPFPNPGHVREGYREADLVALFPAPQFVHLHTSYFLTRKTLDRIMRLEALPLRGMFLPAALADAEARCSAAERKADTPFGIMAAFQKAR